MSHVRGCPLFTHPTQRGPNHPTDCHCAALRPLKPGSQAARLLVYLTNNPGATSLDITYALRIPNVTGRVSDLRAKGHTIECRKRDDSQDGYFIVPKRAVLEPLTGTQEPLW